MNGPTYGSLFSGADLLGLALEQTTGATCVWRSETDRHASDLIAQHWPETPNHGDITAIDWTAVEPVDLLVGGFPCQDISSAGRGAGIKEGTRSGLWHRYADAVRVLRPRYVFVENVAALIVRGLDIVVGDLAALGYRVEWGCLPASAVGAPHRRDRLFLVAARDPEAGWDGEGRLLVGRVGGPGQEPAGGPSGAPADADHAAHDRERPRPEPGQGDQPPVDAAHLGHKRSGCARDGWPGSADGGDLAPDADGGRPQELAELDSGPIGPDDGLDRRHPLGHRLEDGGQADFGPYADAVARWAGILGRPAPSPLDGRGRLNSWFVEWMMGAPEGHACGRGLPRTAELRILGNSVVPQQGAAAFGLLLDRMHAPTLEPVS